MSLNELQRMLARSRRCQLISLYLMLACIFATCSIHASQMPELTSVQAEQMQDEHDCCEQQQQCCEQLEGLSNAHSFEQSSNDSIEYYTLQLPSVSYRFDYIGTVLEPDKPPTGPPVYLRNCRFTI